MILSEAVGEAGLKCGRVNYLRKSRGMSAQEAFDAALTERWIKTQKAPDHLR
jgi:hypothetical protein